MNHVAKPAPVTPMMPVKAVKAITARALHEALLASNSATAVLELLCGSPVTIVRNVAEPVDPGPQQRLRLELEPSTAWAHRSVQLQSGGRALSQADLWYVPGRLRPDMVAALLATTIPFGRIVAALNPRRLTLDTRFGEPGDPVALHHHALLTIETEGGTVPIAEVLECYFAASFPG